MQTCGDVSPETKPKLGFCLQNLNAILLIFATFMALVWSNLSPIGYRQVWEYPLVSWPMPITLHGVINEGLMPLFFFLIGLELNEARHVGSLSHPKKIILPFIAALGGMIAPACIYKLCTQGCLIDQQGWAIPTATDIAFTLAALSMAGGTLPKGLKTFLLSLAVLDDLGAIVLIACLKKPVWDVGCLLGFGGLLLALYWAHLRSIDKPLYYLGLGLGLWVLCLRAGLHGTLVGVMVGLLIPQTSANGRRLIASTWHRRMEPWVNFMILPVFSLANSGASIRPIPGSTASFWQLNCFWGSSLGLLLGKPIGVFLACLGSVKLRLATLPPETHWIHLAGASVLCGIGFTMALFLSSMCFEHVPEHQQAANLGILLGSLFSACLGIVLLRRIHRHDVTR